MEILNVQNPTVLPQNTELSFKFAEENTNEANYDSIEAKSISGDRDRALSDVTDNFEDCSPFSNGGTECAKIYRALLLENSSSGSTAASLTSLPTRNDSPSLFTPEDFTPDFVDDIVQYDDVEREYFLRCVMIGAKDTGKHALINSNFNQEIKRNSLDRNGSDFLIRSTKQENTTKKYHFWVRTLEEQSETKDILWKPYYKWATAFVFVYDTTNKGSFEALKEEVAKVLKVVPQDQFFGVLVGMKNDQHSQRAVAYEDAFNFKSSHNFSSLFETSSFSEKDTPQLLQRLNRKLKLTFEAL